MLHKLWSTTISLRMILAALIGAGLLLKICVGMAIIFVIGYAIAEVVLSDKVGYYQIKQTKAKSMPYLLEAPKL